MTLFARSFLLIALLILLSAAATYQVYRVYEREPRARALAQQTISIVNLTRAALINADPSLRQTLLIELNEREGIRLAPVTPGEVLRPLPQRPLLRMIEARVRSALGERTRFAIARDGVRGIWVSFFIDGDEYWVMLPRERFEPKLGVEWIGWGVALGILALVGAWLTASAISRPLRAAARAAREVGRGRAPAPLPESGPRELRGLARAFNRMAGDLAALERDRAMVLAGISHDLRTPLSRLRVALELSGAARAEAESMGTDIDEIDQVIGQFLDFARGEDEPAAETDIDALLAEVADSYRRRELAVSAAPGAAGRARVAPKALRRALVNLVDNALRHAGAPVAIASRRAPGRLVLEVLDRGPGIPPGEAERLKQPFTRLDAARGGRGGAGLGLAIVDRIAHAHGGALELAPREGGGLAARLSLPV